MWLILLRVLWLLMLVVSSVCMWKTVELFNDEPENSPYKGILAFDVVLLFGLAVLFLVKVLIG